MSQSSLPPSSRLRWVGIGLIVLLAILVLGNGLYLLINQPSGKASSSSSTPATPTLTTPTVSPDDLYKTVTSKTPSLSDSLDGKHPTNWETSVSNQNGYAFSNGALHGFLAEITQADLENSQVPLTALVECPLRNSTFTNFAFQVQMRILQGDQTFVGLFFRADPDVKHTYRFYVDFYGDYNFATEENADPVGTNLAVFQPGLVTQKTLTLTVIAQNTSFYLYLNKRFLRMVVDTTYSSGGIGLFLSRGDNAKEDVAFSQAEVWKL
jgi:hypothetical protein